VSSRQFSIEVVVAVAGASVLSVGVALLPSTAVLPVAVGAAVIGCVLAPAPTALACWAIIGLVPEWSVDVALLPVLATQAYRSLAGPVSAADVLLGAGLTASLVVQPTAVREFVHRHRSILYAYALFLLVVFLSVVRNGQLGALIPLKPLFYLGSAVLWGFAVGLSDRTTAWIGPLFVCIAVLVILQGLTNSLIGSGRAFAGLHLAFYDRASVYILILYVVFVAQAWMVRSPLLRGAATPAWFGLAIAAVLVTAFSLRRTMWLTLVGALVVSVYLHAHRGTRRLILHVAAGSIIAVTGLGGALAATGYLKPVIIHATSLVSTISGAGAEQSITTRIAETADVLRAIRRRPIIGNGPAYAYAASGSYALALDRTYVHNNYLWLLMHYGVLGLVTFAGLGIATLTALGREYRAVAPTDGPGLARLVLLAGLLGLLPALAGDSFITAHARWPILLGFLVGAALAHASASDAVASAMPNAPRIGRGSPQPPGAP